MRWCDAHSPGRDGTDDATVTSEAFLSGSAEAGGDANRRWCEMLHGGWKARRDTPARAAAGRRRPQ